MTAHPDAEPGEGELWVRDGELYVRDVAELLEHTGAVALFPWEGEVFAYVPGRGKVRLEELLKPTLQAVK